MNCEPIHLFQHREANKNEIVSHDHPVYNKVISVAQQIVDANKDIEFFRDQTWTLWVIENTEPNAMVLPVSIVLDK